MKKKAMANLRKIINNNLFVLKIVWRISKLRFIIKIVVTILGAILPTVSIMVMRYIISLLESDIDRTDAMLYRIFLVIASLTAIQLIPKIFAAFNTALIEPVLASKINNYMNEIFFNKAKEFEYKNFEDPVFYDKYTRALSLAENMPHAVFNSFFQIFGSVISLFALSALIVSMDWVVVLFAVFSVAVNFIQSIISSKLNFQTTQTLTPISRKQNYIKRVLYNAEYAKEIKCNDVIATGKRYYFESFHELLIILKAYGWKIAGINVLVILLTSISSTGLMLYLFSRVWRGIYSIADYSALMSSSGQFEGTLNAFFGTIANFYKNSLEIDNIKFVYFYENTTDTGRNVLMKKMAFKVEVINVSFKYPNSDRYALENVSFEILPGEKVSLVGLNGSGKTTLVKLLLRLYEPESGEILLDGINIKMYRIEEIQKGIGAIFQDHQIFAYSVKENIAFESELGNDALLVLDKLEMHHTIKSLPKGMDTSLSKEFDTDGTLLSGGEAQKICIARVLNKATGLYIFDEPSSALDPISEYKMNSLLYEITEKTVIFISHRLTTAVMADKIFLLHHGKLVESGSHEQLISNGELYSKMFLMQAENYS